MTLLIGSGFGPVPSLGFFSRRRMQLVQASDVRDRGNAATAESMPSKTRIVVLGGGFGGAYAASHLERLFRGRRDIELVLVSRDNCLLVTPLLFEVCSGAVDFRHCCFPIRAFLRTTRFVEADVESIDLERRAVKLTSGAITSSAQNAELSYDQLVLALGAMTNRVMIPGSEHTFTFNTLADALFLRNHIIECFERADVETDADRKQRLLTLVIIGGGLVGVELFGELTAFVDEIVSLYKNVDHTNVRFVLLQAAERIMPEINPELVDYVHRILSERCGAEIVTNAAVREIEPRKVHLQTETIEAETIILAAGVIPHRVVASLPIDKDKRGQIFVDGTMRCRSHPEVWAMGDCVSKTAPDGKPYPNLAQHALQEAKALAQNIYAVLNGRSPQPFAYQSLGMMGSLGHCRAFGQILGLRLRGSLAWFIRRAYYLMQMPGWSRRLGIMIDWTFALLFRPEIVKVSLDSEATSLLRKAVVGAKDARPLERASTQGRAGVGNGSQVTSEPVRSVIQS